MITKLIRSTGQGSHYIFCCGLVRDFIAGAGGGGTKYVSACVFAIVSIIFFRGVLCYAHIMKRRLKIVRSPKKIPKESRWISANEVIKSDPCDDSSGVVSHFSIMLDGLCYKISYSSDGTMISECVPMVKDEL